MYEFKFPDVGEGITEGEIVKWVVKEGDKVKEDDVLGQIETDKAVVDIPSPKSGTILKIHIKEGEIVKVGETLVTIGEESEKISEKKKEIKKEERKTTSVVGSLEEAEEEIPIIKESKVVKEKEVLAMPYVRKLAKELNVDITRIKGSGKDSRITEEDIRNAKVEKLEEKKPEFKIVKKYDIYGYVERVPLKGVRKTIARNMIRSSNEIAAVTSMDDVDITKLSEIREKEKKIAEEKGVKLTFLPFIIKAVITALKEHPYLNSSLENEEIILKKYYNIGVAIDTEYGLLVPVVKGVEQKSILDIAKEIFSLADKARNRKIDLADLKGGTFTITNYGSIGGNYGTPIINYPEAAILGLGRIFDRVMSINKRLEVRKILPLSLTFDHRILDGAEAARFLNKLKGYLEDPDLMLIEK